MNPLTARDVIDNFDLILLDAFGVLVDDAGAIPGAASFIDQLIERKKDFFILTNGSKFTPEVSAEGYRKKGLKIEDHQVLSSGSLLKDWAAAKGHQGRNAWVLGPESSLQVVKDAGLKPVNFQLDADCLVLTNQDGFNFPGDLDALISRIFDLHRRGKNVELVCPNPDVVYPLKSGHFRITTGALAVLVETSLNALMGAGSPKFSYLGKPFPPLFDKATAHFKGKRICLIGDQLTTDIKGANDFGITSILVTTGITKEVADHSEIKPHFILKNLSL